MKKKLKKMMFFEKKKFENENFIYDILEHLCFFVLIFLSFHFALERIIISDAAYYTFNIINNNFFTAHGRYTAVIPQILPFLFIYFKFEIKTIIFIYSLSFYILFYSIYLISNYFYKNKIVNWTIIMFLVIGIAHNFFAAVTELRQGIIYSILIFANLYYVRKNTIPQNIIFYLTSFLIILLSYFSHPTTLFTLVFIIVFYMIDKKEFKNYKIYILLIFIFILYSHKYFSINNSSYEGEKLNQMDNFFNLIFNIKNFYSFKFAKARVYGIYLIPISIFIFTSLFYIIKKKFLKFAFYTFSTIFFFLIIVIIFNKGDAIMSMEKVFMPINIFIIIPFFKDIFFHYKKYKFLKFSFLIIIFLFSIRTIIMTGKFYKKRIYYLDEFFSDLGKYNNQKFLINQKRLKGKYIIGSFAFAQTSLLYTSLKNKNKQKTVYLTTKINKFKEKVNLKDKKLFLNANFHLKRKTNFLNRNYFNLKDEEYFILK